MLGRSLRTVLFVALQLSPVFCRSEGYHDSDENKGSNGPVIYDGEIAENSKILSLIHRLNPRKEVSVRPEVMAYDTVTDLYDYRITSYYTEVNYFAWFGLILGLFSILSFILGCVLFLCCRSRPRPGMVLRDNRVECPVQQPQPVTVQRFPQHQGNMPELPPPYQLVQQSPQQYQPVPQTAFSPGVHPGQQHSPMQKETRQSPTTIEFHNPLPYQNPPTDKY